VLHDDKALSALDTIVLTVSSGDGVEGGARGLDAASVVRTTEDGPRKLLLGPGTLFRVSARGTQCTPPGADAPEIMRVVLLVRRQRPLCCGIHLDRVAHRDNRAARRAVHAVCVW
jgi:hypothetical protein